MATVQKISFKSETNLLQKAVTQSERPQTSLPVSEVIMPQSKNDTFVGSNDNKEKTPSKYLRYIKEYSGIGALALSITAIPITYAITKKKVNKNTAELENKVSELTKKIGELIEQSSKKTPEQLSSKTDRLTTILLGIGTGVGVGAYIKNNKEELKKMGYSDEEIDEMLKRLAVGSLSEITKEQASQMIQARKG